MMHQSLQRSVDDFNQYFIDKVTAFRSSIDAWSVRHGSHCRRPKGVVDSAVGSTSRVTVQRSASTAENAAESATSLEFKCCVEDNQSINQSIIVHCRRGDVSVAVSKLSDQSAACCWHSSRFHLEASGKSDCSVSLSFIQSLAVYCMVASRRTTNRPSSLIITVLYSIDLLTHIELVDRMEAT